MGRRIFSAYPFYTCCILNYESVLFIQKFNLSTIKPKQNQTVKLLSGRIISINAAPNHKYRVLYTLISPGLGFSKFVFPLNFQAKKGHILFNFFTLTIVIVPYHLLP